MIVSTLLLWICIQTLVTAQVADFTADVTTGCFPLTVKFTDTSTGAPTGWEWDFGNGNSSPLQNPSAVYSAPGTYTVSLTASKGATSNTKTQAGYIKVYGPPTVNFSFDKASGCAPLSVNFEDKTSTASGTITNWFWVFGDGGTSQAANPTYIFEQPGPKTVSLKVRNEHGCEQTKVFETPIDVRGPLTMFTPSSSAICTLPATFTFTNNSIGQGAMTHQWAFGDGQTSTAVSPAHTYQVAGGYSIVLRTTDQTGCTTTATQKIYAGSDGGIDFTTLPDPVCPGQPITFTASSVDPISSYEWTFDNGATSSQISPTTTYETTGVYQVTLRAQLLNHACVSVVTKPVVIIPPAVPTFDKSLDCNLNLLLISNSTHATRVEWYINDILVSRSVKFTSPIHLPGNQRVKLVAFNAAGCGYEKEETVTLMTTPVARFTPNDLYTCKPDKFPLAGCAPFTINFVNTSTAAAGTNWLWTFGDGTTSAAQSPSHMFTTRGTYQVKLTASNTNGCSTTATATVKVSDAAPVADFQVDKTLACAGEIITFTDTSLNAEAWCWNFGDGWIGDGKVTEHAYAHPGTYTVTLTAKNGCNGVVTKTNLITIKNPNISFEFVKTCEDPFNVQLKNLSTNYDELHWEFGDGQSSTVFDPGSHQYATEGLYELTLIGTNNSTGCTTVAFVPLTIQQVTADFFAENDKPCVGMPITFVNDSHAAVKWSWTLGPYTSDKQEFAATLFTPGNYTATLEVKDSDSCKAIKTVPVQVINMKGDFSFTAASTCNEFVVDFTDKSTGTPPPTSWLWEFGDGQISNQQNPEHSYTTLGKHDVALHVSNAEGSCRFTKEDFVDFRVPVPDFAVAKNKFCVGETVTLANTSVDASSFEWFYGDGRSSELQSPEVAFGTPGDYTVTLVATDEFGCERRVIKSGFVKVVQPVADFTVDKATGSCPPFTATFQDKSATDITNWQWAFGNGQTSTIQNPSNIYTTAGAFNVTLSVTDANGCTAIKASPQFVTVGGPSGAFNTAGSGSCTNKEVTFTASTLNTSKMTWDFGDGVVLDQMATMLTHEYNSTGTFTPSLLLTDANGCKVLALGSAEIIVKDTTAITTRITPSCVFTNESLQLMGETESDDELVWLWTVDGVMVGSADELEISISEPGVHTVTGYATNEFACVSSVATDIHVQGNIDFVPNVITPNGDGRNQTFKFDGLDNSEWDLGVIDRWGKEVYQEKSYKGNWDADDLPAGVYYFILRNGLCEGRDVKGVISIVR